jgi:hypothetical protein
VKNVFRAYFSTSSNILNTSSDNQAQVEKLLKSLIKTWWENVVESKEKVFPARNNHRNLRPNNRNYVLIG